MIIVKYSKEIEKIIETYTPNKLIVARELYILKLSHIPELTFYKTLERLTKKNKIIRVSKGLYCIPKSSRFGEVGINQKETINYFTGENNTTGMMIGYLLYNKYGLTTQISKTSELYSNVITEERKVIHFVRIYKMNMELSPAKVNLIELLEILENYNKIEDLNEEKLKKFISHAITKYESEVTEEVLGKMKYKKSTIALLSKLLDYYGIQNSLKTHFSTISTFKMPIMEEIYEFAR